MTTEHLWHDGIAFMLGTLFGSFAHVCIYRFPQRLSPVFPGSHSPSCQEALHLWHDIPVLSYVLSVGRCATMARAQRDWYLVS